MRVLLVSSSSGSHGGGELYLVGLAQGLHELGHQVVVVVATHPRMDKLAIQLAPWADVCRMNYVNTYDRLLRVGGAILDRRGIRDCIALFKSLHPDVIHVNKQNLEDGLDLVLAAAQTGIPHLATIHITRSMRSLGATGGWMRDAVAQRVLAKSGCHCLATSKECEQQLRANRGHSVPVSLLHRVSNGVSDVAKGERKHFREEWNCNEKDFVLGCVARIEAQKNPLMLIRVLANLPDHVRLVWVGDGRMREEMLELAAKLNVTERVHIDGWREDSRQRMAGFDMFVLPSAFEGFPFALLEAMAAGMTCVASDVDGIKEAILTGETGCLCPGGDVRAWQDTLTRLVSDSDERKRLGERARQHYEECFSLESMARGTARVYHEVISHSR